MCHILLSSVPVDNIVELFISHKILTYDDIEVISFAPSEYLKKKVLLSLLLCLKVPTWLIICDMLHNAESTRHVDEKLKDGKLFQVATYV